MSKKIAKKPRKAPKSPQQGSFWDNHSVLSAILVLAILALLSLLILADLDTADKMSQQAEQTTPKSQPAPASATPKSPAAVKSQPAPATPKSQEPSIIAKPEPKALLAIIIDDVASSSQLEQIVRLNARALALTPSFLPNAITPKLARDFGVDFMLHLPLEALNFAAQEPNTLLASASCEEIKQRLDVEFARFSGLKIINNHTGSKFSESERAMRCLMREIAARKAIFIDSRTSANTKAPQIAAELKQPYIARDVFLDNDPDTVLEQLELACHKARANGTAIAIAHPHESTFAALSKFSSCEGVRLVSVHEPVRHLLHE